MDTYSTTPKSKQVLQTKKRTFWVSTINESRPLGTSSYWSEGSISRYQVLNFRTGKSYTPPAGQYPTFKAEITLEPNEILIHLGTSVSGGKPGYPHVTCYESEKDDVLKFLGVK